MDAETEELTKKVKPLLEEDTMTDVSSSRLPDNGQRFENISSMGLATLRKHSTELALSVERTEYGSYTLSEEDYT